MENCSIPVPAAKGEGEVVTSRIFSSELDAALLFLASAENSVRQNKRKMAPSEIAMILLAEHFQFGMG